MQNPLEIVLAKPGECKAPFVDNDQIDTCNSMISEIQRITKEPQLKRELPNKLQPSDEQMERGITEGMSMDFQFSHGTANLTAWSDAGGKPQTLQLTETRDGKTTTWTATADEKNWKAKFETGTK
jgi:hypothetical protein